MLSNVAMISSTWRCYEIIRRNIPLYLMYDSVRSSNAQQCAVTLSNTQQSAAILTTAKKSKSQKFTIHIAIDCETSNNFLIHFPIFSVNCRFLILFQVQCDGCIPQWKWWKYDPHRPKKCFQLCTLPHIIFSLLYWLNNHRSLL